MERIYCDFCGIEECCPGDSFGPHVRECYVLCAVIKGRGMYWNGRSWFNICADSAFLIYPGEEAIYRADPEEPWQYCWIGFHGEGVQEMMECAGFGREKPVIAFDEGTRMMEIIHEIMQDGKNNVPESFFRQAGIKLVMELFLRGAQNKGNREAAVREISFLSYATRYLRHHFPEKILVGDLAARIGISRSYLVRLFRECYGVSPQEYLIRLRMQHAVDRLVLTDDPIGKIASECGYPDPLAFSKIFKQRFGKSPRLYREENRSGRIEEGGEEGSPPAGDPAPHPASF